LFYKKQNKNMSKQGKQQNQQALSLGVLYPNAAGIDVGSMSMYVSYQNADNEQTLKVFDAYTADLSKLAKEMQQAGVTHVAMEATSTYWMPLFEVLEKHGLNVTLINARHYKNVDGQKTDVKDCQWIQQLHAHGLLRPSHIAGEEYRELRTYIHERDVLQHQKSDALNRMHKVLTQMNIKWQHVISDIEGVEGMKVVRRLADGVTKTEDLLRGVKTDRLKASKEVLEKSLEGLFKPHYQVVLKNHLATYDFYKQQMLVYEQLIEEVLQKLLANKHNGQQVAVKEKTIKVRKNQYHFNLKTYLHQIVGVDLTEIDGLDEASVLTIIAVIGLNMRKWPTAEHFVSWLNLAARPKKSGGKVLGHQKRFTNNPATQAFRLAAQTMHKSKSSLGSLYRRLASRKSPAKAIKAVARKIAIILYNMIKKQTKYNPKIVVMNEEKIRARKIARLQKEAEKLGCRLETIAA
jgi:transposase